MFLAEDILYEDNHILVVNKRCGDLVQPSPDEDSALENEIKAFIKERDHKPGNVFLGVVHRIDRPVSGCVLFAKTSKALTRLNEMIRQSNISKHYWAVVESQPQSDEGVLTHYLYRDGKSNHSKIFSTPGAERKLARLNYKVLAKSDRYTLLDVELITGRHHQIRAQLSFIGCPIKGDLKYGAKRSNPSGGISLHSRSMDFKHPVSKEDIKIVAPVPTDDNLWQFFEQSQS
ncbi:MAG: RNA pseudouridine synthase [Alistipes sp.]|nr:RNA pseudouridine synthase [Candidatus Alistipes equi]